MKWRKNKPGEERIRYRFAWIPTKVGEYTVWLEEYAVRERWAEFEYAKPQWIEIKREVLWSYPA